MTDWARIAATARRPSSVTASAVDELERITDRQRVLYHDLSSAEMLVSVEAHLGLLVTLLEAASADSMRHRIASAAAEAAGFAAWLWMDLGDQYKMATLYEMAADLLRESGNPALSSYVTGYQALADESCGLRSEAIQHGRAAVDQAPAATSRLTRSWLCAIGANAAALDGDRSAASGLLIEACDHLDAAAGKEEWMYDFDHAALAGYHGRCLLRLDRAAEAAFVFGSGLASVASSCDRRRAQLTIGLAEARLATGQVDEAMSGAKSALEVFSSRGSAAGLRGVQRFHELLIEAGHLAQAAELRDWVHAHLSRAR